MNSWCITYIISLAELLLSHRTTFSPNAIKHYLQILSVLTKHVSHLHITVASEIQLKFPSLPVEFDATGMDFFRAEIVVPPMDRLITDTAVFPPWEADLKAPTMTRALIH
jgi:hypothetical protein